MPKIYSEEFKASALELLEQGMTQKQVCQDLGMSKSALQAWVNEARLHQHGFEPAEGTEGKTEQARMLRRIRELEQENEILRQATAYLSQANLKPGQARPK
jgi:transposase